MANQLRLISFDVCPYVERSRIVLHEKDLPYEITFIDLKNKPDWFLKISPMGKVPVLLVDDRPIFESTVINELLEELNPEPSLFPKAPLDRAEARAWIVFCNDSLMPLGFKAQMALAKAPEPQGPVGHAWQELLEPLRTALGTVESALARNDGPWFLGDKFALVDASYAPFFRRWKAAESWRDTPLLADFPRLAKYAEALLARPSVIKADPGEVGPRTRQLLIERAG